MAETYCLDCLEILLEADVAPDRSPETGSVARNDSDSVLEDVYRQSLRVSCYLSLEVRVAVYFALLDVECTYFLAVDVNEDCRFDLLSVCVKDLCSEPVVSLERR